MSRRSLIAVGSHVVVVVAATLLFRFHSIFIDQYDMFSGLRPLWLALYAAALVGSAYAVGLPDEAGDPLRSRVGAAVVAVVSSAIVISLVQLAVGSALLPRFVVLYTSLFAVVWYALCAAEVRRLRNEGEGVRVLAVVTDDERTVLERDLKKAPERSARLAGHCSSEAFAPPTEVDFDLIVLDRIAMADPDAIAWASAQHSQGKRVRTLALFYEEWLGKLPLAELQPMSLMFDVGEVHRRLYARQKRVADLLAGLVLLGPTVVVGLLLVLLNLVGNRGPLLYSQPRVGRNGEIFHIRKFRTMKPSAAGGSDWTATDDPRITPLGKILRRTHIDELPQAWNLLRGHISLVGPRPEQPQYVERLSAEIDFYDVRHLIRPGITGWAQVKFPYGASVADTREKLQYDFFYLRRQGVQLDARILVRTVRSVLLSRGR